MNDIKSGKTQYHLDKLQKEDVSVEKEKHVFKANNIAKGKQNIKSIKEKLICGFLQKIEDRFPDDNSNLIYAFAVLRMRPISFCSKLERDVWENDKLDVLINKFGEEQKSVSRCDQPSVTREPIIDADDTRREWSSVKELVIQEGYPRDKMSELWYYSSEFPNLVRLT